MSWQSKVRLFSSVPFSNDYAHSRLFDNKTQQKNYFNTLESDSLDYGRQIKIDEGFIDINRYSDTNDAYSYIEITNVGESVGRTYYAFVTDIEYINHKTARINFEIDVLQTYMFDVDLKNSFIERSHTDRWISANYPKINVAPENINIGSEYETVAVYEPTRQMDLYFDTMIVITSEPLVDLSTYPDGLIEGGTIVNGVASPLFYYIVLLPKEFRVRKSNGKKWAVKFNGEYLYKYNDKHLFDTSISALGIFRAVHSEMHANKIVGINYLPFFPFEVDVIKNYDVDNNTVYEITGGQDNLVIGEVSDLAGHPNYSTLRIKWSDANVIEKMLYLEHSKISKMYLDRRNHKESKLLMYPYTKWVLYDNLGNSKEIKPQYMKDYIRLDGMVSISSSPKIAYITKGYLSTGDFSNALISNVNTDIEVINDHSATYIQGRKNSDRVAQTQSLVGGLQQVVGGIAVSGVSASMGNPMGVSAGVTMAMGGLSNAWFNTASIQAKIEDVRNIPPSLLAQAGASNLALGYNLLRPRLELQMIGKENADIVENHFKMYGVAINKLQAIDIKSRQHYNFIKTIGANITGKVPTKHLEKWRQIFDNGITFWHTNDMLNYTLSNNER